MKDFEEGNPAHGDEGDEGARRENEALSALIRTHATRHRVSDGLRARVQTDISLASLRQPDRDDTRAPRAQRGTRWRAALRWPAWTRGRWAAGMAGFALGALCFSVALPLLQATWRTTTIEDDVVARHVRALQIGPLAEVASTDRHTVKPWFQGRIDYAPPVFDLASEGYPLIGGRIEHLQAQAVATLAYRHNGHVIDLYVLPGDGPTAPATDVRRGYNVVHWSDASMTLWAVSDMDRDELARFIAAWRQRARTS